MFAHQPPRTHEILLAYFPPEISALVLDIAFNERAPGENQATWAGRVSCLELVPRNQATETRDAILGACAGGDAALVNELLPYMQHLFIFPHCWNDPFRIACRNGHVDIAIAMLDLGAFAIRWPLHDACANFHLPIMQLLAKHDVHAVRRHAPPIIADSSIPTEAVTALRKLIA